MSKHQGSEVYRKNIGVTDFGDVKILSKDRPWLLPSNRKLRHLQGISLRNLSVSPQASRSRGKTIDDESLPYALKTPAKIFAQREIPKLEHSRSSTELKSPLQKSSIPLRGESEAESSDNASSRPLNGKLRRRSTLNWTNASPRARQDKLENVVRERMAQTWFSLHCSDAEEPVYVSEVIEKAMNPSFRFFDLNVYGPMVTRQDELIIKFWTKTETMTNYKLLIEIQFCLRSLQFIGKSLENFHHPLPQNCVLFHLSDGIYTSFTDLPLDEPVLAAPNASKQTSSAQPTSSFDALMRLSNLDDCIQDALATRENLTSQINALLEEQKHSLDIVNASSQAEERLASISRALTKTRKTVRATESRRSELQFSLATRRSTITSHDTSIDGSQNHLKRAQGDVSRRKNARQEANVALTGQTRRVCEDLLAIYPIEPFDNKPLSFTIRGLHLPNAASTSSMEADPSVTAAALGFVAHIVHLLSLYLLTPIPYPPSPHGSTSTIVDPVSANMPSSAARTFPLFQKGAVAYRFEYGVFLLNSNIELLMSRQGSRMVDLRHTLPNLKYLLTVLATGKGELPARKRPGVQGPGNASTIHSPKMNGDMQTLGKKTRANGKLPEVQALNDG
ncbi:hypothetical protein ACLMJK_000835 [Lecanora helva]